MTNFREIVTKAVIAKGKKTSKNEINISTESVPNTVLGCWVINHTFSGVKRSNLVHINGSFDINVWYSYDNDSKTGVTTFNYTYEDDLNMDKVKEAEEVLVRCLKQPTVTSVEIKNNVVNLFIEKEMGVELVGDTKVKIVVEDSEDEYVDLTVNDEVDEELDNLTDDYLN